MRFDVVRPQTDCLGDRLKNAEPISHRIKNFIGRDRQFFGRKELPVAANEVFDAVTYKLGVFQAIAEAVGLRANHVKPHGALYNMAVRDRTLADAVARAVSSVDPTLILFASPRSELARAGEAEGLRVAREVFADRNYLANGSL